MAYNDHDGTPFLSQQVVYVLSQEEYNRYGVQSATATITFIHTAVSVDLQVTFTTKGQNPGQSVTLTEQNVSFGNSQRNWFAGSADSLALRVPLGSPW